MRRTGRTGLAAMVLGTVLCAGAAGAAMVDKQESITVTGTLREVMMTNLPDNPWQELCLETAAGERYILIGQAAGILYASLGKQVTVTGRVQPEMSVKGVETPVIEVQQSERVE